MICDSPRPINTTTMTPSAAASWVCSSGDPAPWGWGSNTGLRRSAGCCAPPARAATCSANSTERRRLMCTKSTWVAISWRPPVRQAWTRQLIAYPLGIQLESSEAFLLRCVRRIEPDGSLLCTGEIPAGSTVRLMIGNKELALEAASRAAEQALRPLSKVSFVLVFDSVSRRTLLGFDAAQDIHRIRKIVGLATPQ